MHAWAHRLLDGRRMDHDDKILGELHLAIERLADAVSDQPPMAGALRRFAARLPMARTDVALASAPRDPSAIRGLLYEALDVGALDARGFDWMMLARDRARRARRSRAARTPATTPAERPATA
jgi:hypothetical protein